MTQSPAPPHLGYAKQGQKEGPKGDSKCEEFPVSLQDLEVVGQARDDGLHASHLDRPGRVRRVGGPAQRGVSGPRLPGPPEALGAGERLGHPGVAALPSPSSSPHSALLSTPLRLRTMWERLKSRLLSSFATSGISF